MRACLEIKSEYRAGDLENSGGKLMFKALCSVPQNRVGEDWRVVSGGGCVKKKTKTEELHRIRPQQTEVVSVLPPHP